VLETKNFLTTPSDGMGQIFSGILLKTGIPTMTFLSFLLKILK